jgi:hypothetical protein
LFEKAKEEGDEDTVRQFEAMLAENGVDLTTGTITKPDSETKEVCKQQQEVRGTRSEFCACECSLPPNPLLLLALVPRSISDKAPFQLMWKLLEGR